MNLPTSSLDVTDYAAVSHKKNLGAGFMYRLAPKIAQVLRKAAGEVR